MKSQRIGVFVGRCQPFHEAHHRIVSQGLAKNDRVLVILGSARQARTPKDPFSLLERSELVRLSVQPSDRDRITCVGVRDYLYNDLLWVTEVQQKVNEALDDDENVKVTLLGRLKDRSSYYLRLFPQWACEDYGFTHPSISATQVRESLFASTDMYTKMVPQPVAEWLTSWKSTETFERLRAEWEFLKGYKALWSTAPYPPTFVTTDAVVIQSGHVLIVRRRSAPGKGLYALPGGFIKPDESIDDAVFRELKEETRIQVPVQILKGSVVDSKVFDHPNRSLRGRTITHAVCVHLKPMERNELAPVKGDDDADKAFWMPLADLYAHEDLFFEDHVHIIRYFASRF